MSIVLTLFCITLLVKLRKLTITLLTLQHQIKDAAAQAPYVFDFYKDKVSVQPDIANSNNSITIINVLTDFWTHIFLGAAILALFVIFIHYLRNKICTAYNFNHRCHIALELTYKSTVLTIPIKSLNGKPQSYKITTLQPITDITVTGIIFPTLNFSWINTELKSVKTSQIIEIPQKATLNCLNAILIRYILARDYASETFWIYKQDKYFMDLADSTV